MNDWSIEFFNDYLSSVQDGKVTCELTKDKGRILISKQHFKQGDIIFEEAPLHTAAEEAENEAFKLVRRLCKKDPETFDQDPLWYWAALCTLTAEQISPGPKRGTIRAVLPDTQRKLLCLYHDPVKKPSIAVETLVSELGLSVAPLVVEDLLQAWILNCFDHSDEPQGYAAYFGASLMSHSCFPNAIWHFAEGTDAEDTFVLRAREEIQPSDEICISYLPEEGLLLSAQRRKKELHSTKLFWCTCQRCGPGASDVDRCRGFRCPSCGRGAVFHPSPLLDEKLEASECTFCNEVVGTASERLLAAETWLAKRVKELTKRNEKVPLEKLIKESDAQLLLRVMGDSETGSIGPQHWLCDAVWGLLAEWYDETGRDEDARRLIRLRLEYQRSAYPGLNGQLGWTLEGQADMLLRHLGLEPGHKRPADLTPADVKRIASQATDMYSEAANIMRKMFGEKHQYFTCADNKRKRLSQLLEVGELPSLRRRKILKVSS